MIYLIFFAAAIVLTIIIGKLLLPLLISMKVKQSIRQDGPQRHLSKAGTPTMGGLIFIPAAVILCCFCLIVDRQPQLWVWMFSFLSFGLIGFLDDFAKLRHHENKGLSGRQKLAGQFVAVVLLLLLNELLLSRGTSLSFFGTSFDLGWFYYPLIAVFVVGMVNAVNLTDGLDGLASGVSFFVFAGFALIGFLVMESFPQLYQLPFISLIMAGCCIGFLFFNHYPAKVFMGDTGSMALGGAVAGLAVTCHLEVALVGLGLVYLLEAISVMLQVGVYKLTHKRLFLMAPLHHHFELKGWPETKVTGVFYLASAICVIVTVILFRVICL